MIELWSKANRAEKNLSLAFVYDFKKPVKRAELKVAASTVFRVFLSGELIGYGPRRTGHGYSVINHYDVSDIPQGARLTVEVAGYNVNSYYVVDELPFFAAELSGGVEASSADFACFQLSDRIQKVQRYSFQRPFAEAYVCETNRDAFYHGEDIFERVEVAKVEANRLIEADLPYPDFQRISSCVIEEGDVFAHKNPFLYRDRSIYEISRNLRGFLYEELECRLSDEACALDYRASKVGGVMEKNYKLYDFGRNVTGFIGLEVNVLEDCDIFLMFDEILWDEVFDNKQLAEHYSRDVRQLIFWRMATCSVVKYSLKKGTYRLLTFEPYTMRYLKVAVTRGKAECGAPTLTLYQNPDIYRTKFECEDKDLERVFIAAQHTVSQNAVDVLTDCPSRERAGWLCDSFFSSRVERLLTGGNRVEKNFLKSIYLGRGVEGIPAGMLPMCYPSDHYDGTYIPNWAMWFVIELNDYLKRTGDAEFVSDCREMLYDLAAFFERFENESGLLERLNKWVCVEHSRAADFVQDVSYPTNMVYSLMLRCMGEMYGDGAMTERANRIRDAVREQSFNGAFFVDNAVRKSGRLERTENTTETCQYYAFFTGIATKQLHGALYDKMLHEFGPNRDYDTVYPNVYKSNAFIGNYLRLVYFHEQGEKEELFSECKDYFLHMVNRTMTLWEHDNVCASCNHGFASYPTVLIVNLVTGFQYVDERKRQVHFERPSKLLDCKLTLPVEGGSIHVENGKGKQTIVVPEGYRIVRA